MLKNRKNIRRGVVLTVAAGLLLPATLAIADHVAGGAASFTGCLNKRGEVYNLTQGTNTAEPCRADDVKVHLGGGDITAVVAGTGLTGGGTNGDVTLGVDTAVVQSRVTGQCTVGSAIQAVNADGTVTCQATGAGLGSLIRSEELGPLDLNTNPVVCQNITPYTPTSNTRVRVDSWASLKGTDLMTFTIRNVISTDDGATWTNLDLVLGTDSTSAAGQWGHATNTSPNVSLVAGRSYRFGVQLGVEDGPDPSAGRCELNVLLP